MSIPGFTLWFDSKKGGKSLSVIADKPKGAQYKIVVPAVSPNTIYSFKVQCVNGTGWGTSGKTKYYMTPVGMYGWILIILIHIR